MHETDIFDTAKAELGLVIRRIEPVYQWSLRMRASVVETATIAWRAPLALAPLSSSAQDGRNALRLGPDEWLLAASSPDATSELVSLSSRLPLSIVDISHREIVWELSGKAATRVLAIGCPLDLSDTKFPPGHATRTLFGHAEIVLWRPGSDQTWQIRALRSFETYLNRHLAHACRNCETTRMQ